MKLKYLFIDRDGTLVREPDDQQIDSIEKVVFMPFVFESLAKLRENGYRLVMVTNQDGLGTDSFPQEDFDPAQNFIIETFASQGITFESVKICPHFDGDRCRCRKPEIGLLQEYFLAQKLDQDNSYVIGDRDSDMALANNIGVNGFKIEDAGMDWKMIAHLILDKPRLCSKKRTTNETDIAISVNLDSSESCEVSTGNRFFDHMLEQTISHAGISATIVATGDMDVDDHHTVEDIAIVFGDAIKTALGNKKSIARYGFLIPMDESEALISLDLSGRYFCQFECDFSREKVGSLSTEMVPHFFRSFAESLKATLHIKVTGSNGHHQCEAAFKGLGRVLRQAIHKAGNSVPSTKGVL